ACLAYAHLQRSDCKRLSRTRRTLCTCARCATCALACQKRTHSTPPYRGVRVCVLCSVQSCASSVFWDCLGPDSLLSVPGVPNIMHGRSAIGMSALPQKRTCAAMSALGQKRTLTGEHYSITSSARCCMPRGTDRPSALAVFRLITISYLVGV